MITAPSDDPFDDVQEDAAPITPAQTVAELLDDAKRGYVPIRRVFVQKPRTEDVRAAKLAELVQGRHHQSLNALLLLHALEPILRDQPLDMRVWARLLSTKAQCTANAATKAFTTLVDLDLVSRSHDEGQAPVLRPLHEGTGEVWTRPGEDDQEGGPGYFTLPHAYWTSGYADQLTLPGKAMLLIMLAETQQPTKKHFAMAVSQAKDWYGISERTAERGYRELNNADLLLVKIQKVPDSKHPAGRREIWHRALSSPFSTVDRFHLQHEAKAAAEKNAAAKSANSTSPDSAQ
ncbi:MAG: hypothetical protein JWR37_6127 [Mycobacterium sp.]|nr:hypothetical protein [Mycobacterium sp.]